MSEKKFKVGDRVTLQRAVDVHIDGGLTQICPGEVGIIDWTNGEDMEVYFGDYVKLELHASQVERVEPTDPRAAFLKELKELMTRHDARIFPINGLIANGIGFVVGSDDIYYNLNKMHCKFITSDNIMDYEK